MILHDWQKSSRKRWSGFNTYLWECCRCGCVAILNKNSHPNNPGAHGYGEDCDAALVKNLMES